MTNPNILPPSPGQEPTPLPVFESGINPFAGNQPVEQQPSRLSLDGSVLNQAGVLTPSGCTELRPGGELVRNAEEAAKRACGLIAEMFIKESDPDSLVFPQCDDISVVNLALQQIGNTPLGLGFGKFPDTVPKAWARFLGETMANYRQSNNLETADLVPVTIHLPDWLSQNPSFDILEGCELMDIKIDSPVQSTLATNVRYCRIVFEHQVYDKAVVGVGSSRSTFIFENHVTSHRSFQNASNISVQIKNGQRGTVGPMAASTVICTSNDFGGMFEMKRGTGCVVGPGVIQGNNTREV